MEKTRSLKKNDLFLLVYKKGSRVHHKYFVLHFYPNGKNFCRLGIKVSPKIAGAVGRNRVKRLVREVFRLLDIVPDKGYDFIVVAKDGVQNLSGLKEVSDVLTLLLCRTKIKWDKK